MTKPSTKSPCLKGFTLLELLVVVGVIILLAGLALGGIAHARTAADRTAEMAAAKRLTTAYSSALTDNNGIYFRGMDRDINHIEMPDGMAADGPAAWRYPFRLAAYFENQLNGTILVGKNTKKAGMDTAYNISVFPAFGINYKYIGGDWSAQAVEPDLPNECVTHMSEGRGRMLLFASAGSGVGATATGGYCILTPPQIYGPLWSTDEWTAKTDPGSYGNVDARYNGKAICAFLDGSVSLLSIEELRDMRLWNANAIAEDNANYTAKAPTGGGRPRR